MMMMVVVVLCSDDNISPDITHSLNLNFCSRFSGLSRDMERGGLVSGGS